MSQFPELVDIFTDKTGSDSISSSDPNNAFDGIETTQGLIGALGKPQSWSITLMTLLRRHRRDMRIEADAGTLYARAGEAVLENTDGTRWVYRRNASDVTISASNLDVGSMVVGTYYIYAKGGTAATTAPIIFSTDPIAPSAIGTAPYRKLGWFYNSITAILSVTYAGDIKDDGNQVNAISVISASTPYFVGAAGWVTYPDMTLPLISNGRPIRIFAEAAGYENGNGQYQLTVGINIDGVLMASQGSGSINAANAYPHNHPTTVFYLAKGIVAGTHTVELAVNRNGGSFYNPKLLVEEL